MKNKIISLVLVLATLFSIFAVTVNAASGEEFISEVALVYENSVEDAKRAIEGTDWKLFEQDLNPDADVLIDDGVYLIYKTSTNVEDAITDLRVMDMYGGFGVTNYEKQLEASRTAYTEMIGTLRLAVAEFKEKYKADDEMAKLAYRQMNYYKDVKTEGGTETDMKMGDFFLNMPTDDKVVQVLFEGNAIVVSNLISLLAVGISGQGSDTLSTKVREKYAIKDTLTDEAFYDDASSLLSSLADIRAKLLRYDALASEHTLDDENISEEEFVFMAQYASLAILLEEIKLGETSFADLVRGGKYTEVDLYPIVAALTEGQLALIKMGQFETVLKYNSPSKPTSELNALLDEMETEMKDDNGNIVPVDVYMGVDRSVFKGTVAFTTAAERHQAITGETWDMEDAKNFTKGQRTALITLVALDAACVVGLGVLGIIAAVKKAGISAASGANHLMTLVNANGAMKAFKGFAVPMAKGLAVAAVALAMIAAGTYGICKWYNYYNPDYTEIPNTMIDIVSTSLGDKYVKYTAAKVFGEDDKKNADFNAYEGKEWIALYYTKDATAGNCLIPKFVYKDNDATIARRHQGIAMFGESKAFNLNTHVYSKEAPGVYVTIRYSTTQKAAASTPSVVGSMFATGALYVVTAAVGGGIGVGATFLVQRGKEKKNTEEDAPESKE